MWKKGCHSAWAEGKPRCEPPASHQGDHHTASNTAIHHSSHASKMHTWAKGRPRLATAHASPPATTHIQHQLAVSADTAARQQAAARQQPLRQQRWGRDVHR